MRLTENYKFGKRYQLYSYKLKYRTKEARLILRSGTIWECIFFVTNIECKTLKKEDRAFRNIGNKKINIPNYKFSLPSFIRYFCIQPISRKQFDK